MATVLLAAHLAGDPAAIRLIRAMAEAGMIGGLADWFAVEVLFRHPLGLPIPHTALLPRNQGRAPPPEVDAPADRLVCRTSDRDARRHGASQARRSESPQDHFCRPLSTY
jgi:hypothetical protein